ncbi:hypothetical protein C9J85_01690 [Haloferax sp. wsp5]|nr:hypothetical protein C9J85_01690 [Haloferax sp. wsp5]
MEPDFSPLAEFLGDEFDGYLISADGSDSNQLYLSGFDAPDPYVTLYAGDTHLLVPTAGVRPSQARVAGRDRRTLRRFRPPRKVEEYGPDEAVSHVLAISSRPMT